MLEEAPHQVSEVRAEPPSASTSGESTTVMDVDDINGYDAVNTEDKAAGPPGRGTNTGEREAQSSENEDANKVPAAAPRLASSASGTSASAGWSERRRRLFQEAHDLLWHSWQAARQPVPFDQWLRDFAG